jgi:chemotaxis protein methyltransferase CheR
MNHSDLPDPQLAISQLDFDFVRNLVRRESSIDLDQSKAYLVISRLSPVAREHGFDSVGALISHLQSSAGGALHGSIVEAIATTETSFFRDLHPFNALRDEVLPELIRRRENTSRTLSVWSAACSSGQEPHGMAMLLRDRFPDLAGWNLQLVASDISESMLQRAREGLYTQLEINRGLPAPYLIRFFDQDEDQWKLKPEVRRMFRFFKQNLADEWSMLAPLDLLVMRNVLIYFDVATRRDMLRKVRKILKPDGYLLLGSAETTLHLDELFTRVRIGRTVFYQVSKGA